MCSTPPFGAPVILNGHEWTLRSPTTTASAAALTIYQYSVFQLELIRNLLFRRGTMMDEVYQKLIERTRVPPALKQVKTIFGLSHRPHRAAKRGRERTEVFNAVQAPSYDLTVFKSKWGNPTLKIHDKGGRVLRIEVVVHNAKELRSGKMLEADVARAHGGHAGAFSRHRPGRPCQLPGRRGRRRFRGFNRPDDPWDPAIGGHRSQ